MKVSALLALLLAFLPGCKRPDPPPDSGAAAPPPQQNEKPVAGAAAPRPATKKNTSATPTPTADGEALFLQHCATCHMANGSGVPFLQPDIRRSAWISAEDPQPLLKLILRGSAAMGEFANSFENDMPPSAHLSDADIAALATRVREKLARPPLTTPITAAEVATARSQ